MTTRSKQLSLFDLPLTIKIRYDSESRPGDGRRQKWWDLMGRCVSSTGLWCRSGLGAIAVAQNGREPITGTRSSVDGLPPGLSCCTLAGGGRVEPRIVHSATAGDCRTTLDHLTGWRMNKANFAVLHAGCGDGMLLACLPLQWGRDAAAAEAEAFGKAPIPRVVEE